MKPTEFYQLLMQQPIDFLLLKRSELCGLIGEINDDQNSGCIHLRLELNAVNNAIDEKRRQ